MAHLGQSTSTYQLNRGQLVSIQMKWILEIPKCIYIYMYHTHIYVSYIIVSLSSKQMNMSTAAKIIPVCCYTKLRKIHHSEILFLCGLGKIILWNGRNLDDGFPSHCRGPPKIPCIIQFRYQSAHSYGTPHFQKWWKWRSNGISWEASKLEFPPFCCDATEFPPGVCGEMIKCSNMRRAKRRFSS